MFYQEVATECIDDASIPWVPMSEHAPEVLPKHHHTGTAIVYTVQGSWKYIGHDWVAGTGSLVFETAASSHMPQALPGDDIITFSIVQGELVYLDENDRIISTENWKSALHRYLSHCERHGIVPKDVTAFGG
ncbi:2,4'-dihydroxyacetophenone dioxygenase family protein [Burkholderia anthina]|uniref:2,4'-dihydroxyacetophenone dioxygenase family protein n=1 Tax=Burkholderia anthina TaxID=179879 RepID=UPI001CF4C5BB|nr:2,4'-dihydroxyacetophenone dioxygenase family protein [Burkholderia anthina]MCA8095117.1 2,4'-dihydroxyacetophenone dioxygenase family protein [Burkholderia anthina]